MTLTFFHNNYESTLLDLYCQALTRTRSQLLTSIVRPAGYSTKHLQHNQSFFAGAGLKTPYPSQRYWG